MPTVRLRSALIFAISFYVAGFTATILQAQAPADPAAVVATQRGQSRDLAQAWLYSADPRAVAWGAFVALRDKQEDLVPDLIELAGRYHVWSAAPTFVEIESHNSMQQVLDAIIQMNHTVTPEIAANLYSEFPVESLIFLSRAGTQATPILLDIFQHGKNDWAWLAAGNLLLDKRPAGFAASVLGGLSVNAVVYVIDSSGLGGSIGSGLSSCGDAFATPPRPGWPAVAAYYFSTKAAPGHIVLSDGAATVYYVRIEASNGNPGGFGECNGAALERNPMRARFLAHLAGLGSDDPLVRIAVTTMVNWTNDQKYLNDIAAFVDSEEQRYDALADRLVQLKVLSEEERESGRPTLTMEIIDRRSKASNSLPLPQNLPANVRLK